jgi:phosphate transport system permease protein
MSSEGESAVAEIRASTAAERAAARERARTSTPNGTPFGKTRTPLWHKIAEKIIALMAMGAVAAIALIFIFIGREAVPLFWEHEALEEVPAETLFVPQEWGDAYDEPEYIWQPVGTQPKYNVVPLFVGTLKVTILAMVFSVPLGILSAIYIAQYAPRRLREVVKPAIELLAGIPSVVLGFFALMVLATWAQDAFGFHFRLNAIVAAMGLSLAVIPIIFTISEDAIQAVPRHLSEGALALGARRYQVTLKVVLPAALPGIAAAVILGFGRAIGETMIVLMASGNAAIMELFDPTTSVRTVTATIAAELGEVAVGEPHWRVLFMLGVMLFAVTFILNIFGSVAVKRLHKKLTAS